MTERLADLIAFDNAPGNMALDAVARAASSGQEAYDVDGRRAARGTIDRALLVELHRHPYLSQPPPKSTGRELFGTGFVNPLLARFEGRLDDLLATLTRFSAEAIARSYREAFPAPPSEVYVCGGGALNLTLMHHLSFSTRSRSRPPMRSASIPRPRRRSPSPCWPTKRCLATRAMSRK